MARLSGFIVEGVKLENVFEDAPMYKLMLLRDDGAAVKHVVIRLCSNCEDMDREASNVSKRAQAGNIHLIEPSSLVNSCNDRRQ